MLPYENATSGHKAVEEIRKTLLAFGASSFGVMDNIEKQTVLIQFTYNGRNVSVEASIAGYAARWLREHPYGSRTRCTLIEHERKAMAQASVSVCSVLRDWIKGQVTAVETQMLSFEGAFLGQIMLPSGESVLERVTGGDRPMLPAPGES